MPVVVEVVDTLMIPLEMVDSAAPEAAVEVVELRMFLVLAVVEVLALIILAVAVAVLVPIQLQEQQVETVVPVSSSSLTHHKYLKNSNEYSEC